MKFKPKDIAIIAVVAAVLIGGGVLAFLLFTGGGDSPEKPQAVATDQLLTPLPRTTTTAPAVIEAPATASASATPTSTLPPTFTPENDWNKGGGGQVLDDPDSQAASAAAVSYVASWINRLGYQNANSLSYLDDLLQRGVITQDFYDRVASGQASPSKTANDKLYVDAIGVSCPMVSQAGPILVDGKGKVKCNYRAQWLTGDGGTASSSTIDRLELPWIDNSVGHTMSVNVVQEGDSWKVDGTS